MLSPFEAKARTYLNFKAMGADWTDEKAKAHADIAPEEWGMVQQEIDKLREPAKDEAIRQLEERVQKLERDMEIAWVVINRLDGAHRPQPKPRRKSYASDFGDVTASKAPRRKRKQNLSPEERKRRSEHMKAIVAKQRAEREANGSPGPTTKAKPSNSPTL